jgi:hypothetical protein
MTPVSLPEVKCWDNLPFDPLGAMDEDLMAIFEQHMVPPEEQIANFQASPEYKQLLLDFEANKLSLENAAINAAYMNVAVGALQFGVAACRMKSLYDLNTEVTNMGDDLSKLQAKCAREIARYDAGMVEVLKDLDNPDILSKPKKMAKVMLKTNKLSADMNKLVFDTQDLLFKVRQAKSKAESQRNGAVVGAIGSGFMAVSALGAAASAAEHFGKESAACGLNLVGGGLASAACCLEIVNIVAANKIIADCEKLEGKFEAVLAQLRDAQQKQLSKDDEDSD